MTSRRRVRIHPSPTTKEQVEEDAPVIIQPTCKSKKTSSESKNNSASSTKKVIPIGKAKSTSKDLLVKKICQQEITAILTPPIEITREFYCNILHQLNTFIKEITDIPYSEEYVSLLQIKKDNITAFLEQIPIFLFGYTDQFVYKVDNRVEWVFDRWPHQTWITAILGELFFPHEFRLFNEHVPLLYERPPVRYRLAIAASYGNPMACYHLVRILTNYIAQSSPFITKAKELKKLFYRQTKKYFTQGLREGNPYIKTISAKTISSKQESNRLAEIAIMEHKNYKLICDYSFFEGKNQNIIKLYVEALQNGYTSVIFNLATTSPHLGEKVIWLLYGAQKENMAIAYFDVAMLLKKHGSATIRHHISLIDNPALAEVRDSLDTDFKDADIIKFLDIAGNLGMAAALREKANMLNPVTQSDEVEAAYIQAAFNLQDEHSWDLLSRFYYDRQDYDQADDCAMKAGLLGYFSVFKELNVPMKMELSSSLITKHLDELEILSQIRSS